MINRTACNGWKLWPLAPFSLGTVTMNEAHKCLALSWIKFISLLLLWAKISSLEIKELSSRDIDHFPPNSSANHSSSTHLLFFCWQNVFYRKAKHYLNNCTPEIFLRWYIRQLRVCWTCETWQRRFASSPFFAHASLGDNSGSTTSWLVEDLEGDRRKTWFVQKIITKRKLSSLEQIS